MADHSHRNPASVPQDGGVPAVSSASQPPALDENGFDPDEFEWRPVPRRPRRDGWTPDRQQGFIRALARTGSVERACEEVGLSVRSAYDLRNSPGGERFAKAWRDVLARAADRVLDIAFEQATVGEEIPIYDQDGVRTGVRHKVNTRMAMLLLRAYHPERFRHAHKEVIAPGEPPPPAAVPVEQAVASLAPVAPTDPERLAPPGKRWLIDDARADAAAVAADPPDDREPWRPVPVPEQPAHLRERAWRRTVARERRQGREDDMNEREGRTMPDYRRAERRTDKDDPA